MIDVDPLDLVDPERFARDGYPHDVWTRLRAEAPGRADRGAGLRAVLGGHEARRHPADRRRSRGRFSSAQGITLARAGAPPLPPSEILVLLDPPKHGPMRRLVQPAVHAEGGAGASATSSTASRVDVVDAAVAGGASGGLDFVERDRGAVPARA